MHADLSRLLARATQSPYFRREGEMFIVTVRPDLGDRTLADWLIAEAIKAYTLDRLPPQVQGFLRDCDRSWQIEQEFLPLYSDQVERDRKVLERMDEEQA